MSDRLLNRRKVLLVDDEPSLRAVFRMALEDEGYAVKCVADGAEAVAAIDAERFDVALLDKNLPGALSGVDVLRYLSEHQPEAAPIMLTGYASTDSVIEALRLGAFDYLKKPVDLAVLIEKIRRAMGKVADSDRFAKILEAMGDGVVVLDGHGQITSINHTALELVGRHVAVGHPIRDLLDGVNEDPCDVHALATDSERILNCADGSKVFVRWNGTILPDPNGGPSGLVSVVSDITAQRQQEQSLLTAKSEAERISAMRAALLANVSHELRTPINGILGVSQMMALDGDNNRDEQLDIIRSCAEQLLGLVTDLLDFSKLEADREALDLHDVTLRDVFTSAVQVVSPNAEKKGLPIGLTIADDLPPRILCDELRVRRILVNLLGNAVKFTSEGRIDVDVCASACSSERADLVVRVTDTGIGIDAAKRDLIFEPFSQADVSTTRVFGGTGLGLSISRQLAALMDGSLELDVGYDAGSRFVLRFPAKVAEATARATQDVAQVRHFVGRPTALLVEDNVVNQKVTRGMLERLGFEVVVAVDGVDAIDRVTERAFDVVLMDFQMPRMGGVDATRIIRTTPSADHHAPTIVGLTANTRPEDREAAFDSGMNDYLNKPIGFTKLAETLARWIDPGEQADSPTRKAG